MQVLSADGANEVGIITRKWFGFIKSVFNTEGAHTFAVTYKQYLFMSLTALTLP